MISSFWTPFSLISSPPPPAGRGDATRLRAVAPRSARPAGSAAHRLDLRAGLGRQRGARPLEERHGLGPREQRAVGAPRPRQRAREPVQAPAQLLRVAPRAGLLD